MNWCPQVTKATTMTSNSKKVWAEASPNLMPSYWGKSLGSHLIAKCCNTVSPVGGLHHLTTVRRLFEGTTRHWLAVAFALL